MIIVAAGLWPAVETGILPGEGTRILNSLAYFIRLTPSGLRDGRLLRQARCQPLHFTGYQSHCESVVAFAADGLNCRRRDSRFGA